MNIKPIVKWAGGKRQIINKLIHFMPTKFNRYFEPFVGGGALLFEVMPNDVIINDINHELIVVYKTLLKDENFHLMLQELKKHEMNHSEEYYYSIRSQDREEGFNNISEWKRAARTIYLNKSCFNGLYRVNSKGYFNVPSGKKSQVKTYDLNNITKMYKYFKNAKITLLETDFEKAVVNADANDFVYFDPPYDSYKNKETFTAYSKFNFSKEDQIRLAENFRVLANRGVFVMLSNHNTKLVNELYSDFNINIVNAKRFINSDPNGRGFVEEVIITSY